MVRMVLALLAETTMAVARGSRWKLNSLQRELDRWKQKYEIAMTFVELHRKLLNGEDLPGEEEEKKRHGKKKKRRLRNPKIAKMSGADRTGATVETNDNG